MWTPYGNGYDGIRTDRVADWIRWIGQSENEEGRPKYLRLEEETKAQLLEDLEAVPKSDLEELVERWRDSHEWAKENREICSNEAIRKAESMIEDLEAVLEE